MTPRQNKSVIIGSVYMAASFIILLVVVQHPDDELAGIIAMTCVLLAWPPLWLWIRHLVKLDDQEAEKSPTSPE